MSFSNVAHSKESLYLGPLLSYHLDDKTKEVIGYSVKFTDGRTEEFSADEYDKVKAVFDAYKEEQRAKEEST